MKIQIVCHDNSAGLSRDRQITYEVLKKAGHEVDLTNNKIREKNNKEYDVNIFHEIIEQKYFRQARKNIFFPNPEWYFESMFRSAIRFVDLICAKTHDCFNIFQKKRMNVVYTSFTSYDRRLDIPKKKKFLHICGKSVNKGTEHIKNAWLKGGMPPLTLIESGRFKPQQIKVANLNHIIDRIPDKELRKLQNEYLFHIYPSRYEGFGHAIWEAKSCGAIILTPNHPPMNEFVNTKTGVLLGVRGRRKRNMATMCDTHPAYIKLGVSDAMKLTKEQCNKKSKLIRADWEKNDKFFKKKLLEVIR